jgi:DNA-binding Xre family transcriptional regulator
MKELDLRYNLKSILRERKMTQLDLAKKLKLKPNNLNTRLARGRNCQLSLLESICEELNVEMKELMYGDNVEAQNNEVSEEEEEMYRLKLEESQKKLIAALEEISNLKDELLKKEVPARKTSNDN